MLETTFEEKFDAAVNELQTTLDKGLPMATAHVQFAIDLLIKVSAELCRAADYVKNTPEDDRLVSLSMSVEDIESEVRKQLERMEKL